MKGPGPARAARVLVAINTAWNVYNFRAGLVRALVGRGYEVVAAAPPDQYSARLAELGCRYVPLPMDNKGTSPLHDLKLMLRFWRLLRRERPDVFLGYTVKPNVYGSLVAHALGIPVVNNIAGLGTAFIRDTWLTGLVKLLYRAALCRSRTVFFQNDDDRQLFVREAMVKREQTKLVPGSGIDLDRFSPKENAQRGEAEPFRFLLVARLLWDKGVGEYVEAARIVRQSAPNTRFQLLGFLDVENRTAIPRTTVERWVGAGLVDYLGAADDVRPLLANVDCVVLPSYREGTPRTLLEAAAMAKPLIATDVPGCRQVVDDGGNGYLCEPRDPQDLSEKMLAMIRLPADQRRAMGSASRVKMEREFDEQIVIQRYLEIVDRIVLGKGAKC
ncbi:glycosyltransferase family 4 protein [Consotaella aegiceratis]|uniref:glycosyltransferase family 4 protein n=1 Tax=Consotaella aegiceratis TaxID=3097961 RepID=UPI002F429C3D